MIRFIKKLLNKLRLIASENSMQVLIKTIVAMVFIFVLYGMIQYDTNILEKRKKKVDKIINEISTDIKISESEYDALISPVRLKQLSNFYLPHFEDIRELSKIRVKDFNN